MIAASSLLALVVAGGFGLVLYGFSELDDASKLARRSAEVTAAANRLEGVAIDLQTGMRGYVITRDERFLEPFVKARQELPALSAELLGLIVDPGQRNQATAIIDQIKTYESEFAGVVVATARVDPPLAKAMVSDGEGRLRLDWIRTQFERFRQTQGALGATREQRAIDQAKQVRSFGLSALVGSLLVLAAFAVYFARAIIAPVRRVAGGANRIAAGDLAIRVPAGGNDEIGGLGRAFNTMAASLQENRDTLGAQYAELAHALGQLAAEKERIDAMYAFGELLAGETYAEALAPTILPKLCEISRAEVGALYAISAERGLVLELASSIGVEHDQLASELDPGEEPVFDDAWGVLHELHVPLVANGRRVGLLALGRRAASSFSRADVETVEHLGAQAAIRIAKRVAYESASRLANINRAVLDSTRDGIRMLDAAGKTVLTNKAMDRLTGGILEMTGSVTMQELIENFSDRTTDPDGYRADTRALAADPELVALHEYELVSGHWIQRYTAPVRDAAGTIIGRIFTVGDITAERKADRLKDEFVASVSHELRTPLTSIRGYLELLCEGEGGPLTDAQRRFLSVVDRNSERLLRLVADLLFVAQVGAGKLPLEECEVDLVRLAEQAVEAARPLAFERGIELSLDADPIPVLDADPARISQLLDNLVSNALKFTQEAGRVEVRVSGRADHIALEVADTGIGISAAEQEHLFGRFFRTRAANDLAIQGTGLGLSISKAIAEAHGGTIRVESEEGAGTTFRVALPLARERRLAEYPSEQLEAV